MPSLYEPFPGLPPFPDTVPTAPLLKISLAKLLRHDKEEEQRLWEVCCDLGFFYLDLRSDGPATNGHTDGTEGDTNEYANEHSNGTNGPTSDVQIDGESLLRDADQLFKVGEELFDLPVEEKQKYDFAEQGSYFGYKGYGSGIVDKKGTKDRNEFYNVCYLLSSFSPFASIFRVLDTNHSQLNSRMSSAKPAANKSAKVSKDDILANMPPLPAPKLLEKHRPLLKSYITTSHSLITLILTHLNAHLALPPNTLQNLHNLHAISGDQVRFIKAPPQPPADRRTALGAHTDFGSVTVLFNRLGGLQVRLPSSIDAVPPATQPVGEERVEIEALTVGDGEQRWAYVRPLPWHAIINLGDALVKFSKGILRSNVHRVVAPPGLQAEGTRFSLVYFSRPEDDAILKPLRESPLVKERCGDAEGGEGVDSKTWILRRALGRRMGGRWEDSAGTEDARGIKG